MRKVFEFSVVGIVGAIMLIAFYQGILDEDRVNRAAQYNQMMEDIRENKH